VGRPEWRQVKVYLKNKKVSLKRFSNAF